MRRRAASLLPTPPAEQPLAFDPLSVTSPTKRRAAASSRPQAPPAAPAAPPAAPPPGAEAELLATLAALDAQTRFSSGGGASQAAASGSEEAGLTEEGYQALLKQFEELGASDPGLAGFLDTMMSQLLSKSVLYEPLQQINARYPSFLAAGRDTLPPAELERFTRQAGLVASLLAVFDQAPEDAERVMQLMQAMQACGAPPVDIMSDVAPGLEFGADGSPDFGSALGPEHAGACAQQ